MKIPVQTRLDDASQTRSLRRMVIPNAMTMEEVSIPGNWAHISSKVKTGDEVIVVPEDFTWRLHLLVAETGIGWVKTVLLHAIDLANVAPKPQIVEQPADIPEDAPMPPAGYIVNFAPAHKWRVMTSDPHLVVSKDHKTRAEAVKAAHDHAAKAQGIAA